MKRILHVVGARPNYMKIAPIMAELGKYPKAFEQLLVHTGQHYDTNMSEVFFQQLGMPKPDINLGVGPGSHAVQTAAVMVGMEPVIRQYNPDWVLVPGDVNSTLAAALVATKMGHKVAHVEAGLRSFDWTMPEEINRVLTDRMSDLLFTPSLDANENLAKEGVSRERISLVGNTMIDTLKKVLPLARDVAPDLLNRIGLNRYLLVTIHRPSNVDDDGTLLAILKILDNISKSVPVVFPVHPRTRVKMMALASPKGTSEVILLDPLGYVDFLALLGSAAVVITDSGGIQEETSFLGIPCLTLRPNTERPITIAMGTNRLITMASVEPALTAALENGPSEPAAIPFWDGKASCRIVETLDGL